MAINTKGIYYSTSADAPITEEARSLALANSIPVGPNYIINGAFDIWQRGTSFSGSGAYTADRWYLNGTSFASRSTDVPNSQYLYSLDYSNSGVQTWASIAQRIEAANARNLVGKRITISFWVKKTSSAGSVINVELHHANSIDNFSSITLISTPSASPTVSSSWQRVSATSDSLPSGVANGLQVAITMGTSPAAQMNLNITGVQVEEGVVATAFHRNGSSYDQEFSSCKRYFWALTPSTLPGQLGSLHTTGAGGYAGFIYGHTFRVAPTLTASSANVLRWHNPGISIGEATSISAATGVDSMQLNIGNSSTLTYGAFYAIEWTTGSGYIWLNAEL